MSTYNFNFGWKFHDGVPADKGIGRKPGDDKLNIKWLKVTSYPEASVGYPDDDWTDVNLPHDFVIERSNFSADNCGGTGSLGGGIGWYRKEFKLPKNILGKRIFIECDGIYRNSEVWCNGSFMGRDLSGFSSSSYELTEAVNYDEDGANAILVTCDSGDFEGWWYTGGGIYRDMRIVIVPKVCFTYNGIYIKPEDVNLETKLSSFSIETEISNSEYEECDATIEINILDGEEVVLSQSEKITVLNEDITTYKTIFDINNSIFWSDKNPHLYKAVISITTKHGTQTEEVKFAPRKIEYDAKEGMRLNGEKIFLYGVCGHDDFAGVGSAMNRSVIEYKVDRLIGMGCNAYRCSHNPPSPVFLDICDEKGMIVMDETRAPAIGDTFMTDFLRLIKRDRNHPSVFYWSAWNEESLIHGKDSGIRIFNKMQKLGKRLDDTRDYMMAINTTYTEVIDYHEANGLKLPLNSVNYMEQRDFTVFDRAHASHPDMCFLNSEVSSDCTIRGYNLFDGEPDNINVDRIHLTLWPERKNRRDKRGTSCYSDCYPTWGLSIEEALKVYDQKPYINGMFIWTGFDYRGEINPYLFPNVISLYGIIDYCGFYKDWAYYLQTVRADKPQIHFMPSTWNLPEKEGDLIDVYVFSNCDELELFLNGESLGRQTKTLLDKFYWEVPYNKGTVLAVGYKDGVACVENKIVTSSEEYKLVVEANKTVLKADGEDSAFISISVVDKDGFEVTNSSIQTYFEITGNGKIIGTGNGNPRSLENDKLPERKLFWGKALAIVQGGFKAEEITFTAKADGIISDSITLTCVENDNSSIIIGIDADAKEIEDAMKEC